MTVQLGDMVSPERWLSNPKIGCPVAVGSWGEPHKKLGEVGGQSGIRKPFFTFDMWFVYVR